ncbi:lipoprotein [Lentzea sp. NPDC051838]|uniref:lipoprotein n=1 Tax=Lentzea sp. NPDC051838 TaxID=3154849 RepID=UPI00344279D2
MRRSLLLLLAVLALSGCAYHIQGSPVAAPLPPVAIATPRKTEGVDPCKLITEKDLKPVGTLKFPGAPRAEMANSCLYTLKENAFVVIAVPYRPFDESKRIQKDGREVETSKHATWLSCGQQEKDMVCTATIAVTRTESLMVGIGITGGTETKARDLLKPIGVEALKQLPSA